MDGKTDRPTHTQQGDIQTPGMNGYADAHTHTQRMNRHRLAGLMDRLMHKMNRLMLKMNRHMGHRYTDTQNGHSNGWMDRLRPKMDRHMG